MDGAEAIEGTAWERLHFSEATEGAASLEPPSRSEVDEGTASLEPPMDGAEAIEGTAWERLHLSEATEYAASVQPPTCSEVDEGTASVEPPMDDAEAGPGPEPPLPPPSATPTESAEELEEGPPTLPPSPTSQDGAAGRVASSRWAKHLSSASEGGLPAPALPLAPAPPEPEAPERVPLEAPPELGLGLEFVVPASDTLPLSVMIPPPPSRRPTWARR
uniref:Uncharacterized protein n=1 Tax=Alexandrium monilatum TaxID=311494 RepID=A0A7S4Q7R5_9DINO